MTNPDNAMTNPDNAATAKTHQQARVELRNIRAAKLLAALRDSPNGLTLDGLTRPVGCEKEKIIKIIDYLERRGQKFQLSPEGEYQLFVDYPQYF